MFLPLQNKPKSMILDPSRFVVEVPNLIDRNVATQLKEFALNTELSGLHRRGSKNPDFCYASFYTCLVFPNNSPIYELLDPAWQTFCEERKPNINFIEPYEIKSYVVNDIFGPHTDILVSEDETLKRKVNLVVQLSDEAEYEGGDLMVGTYQCSRKLGTGIFFPAMAEHSVTEITAGTRFSLIGHAWGPI